MLLMLYANGRMIMLVPLLLVVDCGCSWLLLFGGEVVEVEVVKVGFVLGEEEGQ